MTEKKGPGDMKKLFFFFLFAAILFLPAGCGRTGDAQTEHIKIAVIGEEAGLYPGYQDGTAAAAEDLNSGSADSGFEIEYEFYDYDGSYEEGAAIIDMLAADQSVTAVIGPVDMDLNKTAAYIFNEAGKVFIVPFFLYDSVCQDNHYDMVFSICNSGKHTGEILRCAAEQTEAVRWAVCSADREFERSEMNGFLRYGADDGIFVVDCVSISELEVRFDDIYDRWQTLDVEGVVIFPVDEEGFDLLKQIRDRDPDMICAGDTAFDDSDRISRDEELRAAMNGFIMADEFILDIVSDDDIGCYEELAEQYLKDTGQEFDSWYIQGYNAVRMIADTAVNSGTSDPAGIAQALHKKGYEGLLQNFRFEGNGALTGDAITYSVLDEQGYGRMYRLIQE